MTSWEIDWDSVDHWAVGLVVREHVLMQLNYPEKVLAIAGLRRKKMSGPDIAAILRIKFSELENIEHRWRRVPQAERKQLMDRVSA